MKADSKNRGTAPLIPNLSTPGK